MTKYPKKLIIMAGGTGGHIFPGLTIAHYLISKGWQIHWLGSTTNSIEANLVSKNGIKINYLHVQGIRGKNIKLRILAIISLILAIIQAKRIINAWQPDVVLGMGGYTSAPGGLAAWMCGVPLIIHEQNSIAGLTNRWLAKIANKVLQAFPGVIYHAETVGNPVRKEIIMLPEPYLRLHNRTGPIRILVIGGSQGANILNRILPQVVAQLSDNFTIWHQVGKGSLEKVQQFYAVIKKNLNYRIVEFIDDIATAYAWADIVVCRSGALTVSEIAIVGLPAIFIPFVHKDCQQYRNALLLEQLGAAKIIKEQYFMVDKISEILLSLDRLKLLTMAQCARKIAVIDSTEKVANQIIKLA